VRRALSCAYLFNRCLFSHRFGEKAYDGLAAAQQSKRCTRELRAFEVPKERPPLHAAPPGNRAGIDTCSVSLASVPLVIFYQLFCNGSAFCAPPPVRTRSVFKGFMI